MESIIIHPKDQLEFDLLKEVLTRMNVTANVISEEDQEDLGLAILMKDADRTRKVSKDTIKTII
jgi:hypothetical protein